MKALIKSVLQWLSFGLRFRGLRWLVGFIIFAVVLLQGLSAQTLSEADFRMLARELAPKVNLFAAVWKIDPKAEFYGGTSRDFLYWILGKFRGLTKPEEIQAKILELKKLSMIDITDIIGGDSDVDIITDKNIGLKASSYRVRRFDTLPSSHFAPNSTFWKNDREQGYNPTEKIHLSQAGVYSSPDLGNGVLELLTGKHTLHPTSEDVFWKSYYARSFHNHPLILALRFLRLRAAHWYQTEGSGLPDLNRLLDFDPDAKKTVQAIFDAAKRDKKLGKVLATEKGKHFLHSAVLKAFRAHTNPTAAYLLFEHFGYNELLALHPDTMVPINQFLFIPDRNAEAIAAQFADYKTTPGKVFSKFPHSRVIHGTKGESSFRAIIFQNVMPSEVGIAGRGLYVVPPDNEGFAEDWGESKDRIVSFEIAENAKFIDTTEGAGQALYQEWSRRNSKLYDEKEQMDEFARAFGADIVRYSYNLAKEAYVIKNADVLINRQGLYRKLINIQQGADLARNVKELDELKSLLKTLHLNLFSAAETLHVLKEVPLELLKSNLHLFLESKDFGPDQILAISQFFESNAKLALARKYIDLEISEETDGFSELGCFDRVFFNLEERIKLIDHMITNRLALPLVLHNILEHIHDGYSPEKLREWAVQLSKSKNVRRELMEIVASAEENGTELVRKSKLNPEQYDFLFMLLKEAMPIRDFRTTIYKMWDSTPYIIRSSAPSEPVSVDWFLQKPSTVTAAGPWWQAPEYADWIDFWLKEDATTSNIFSHIAKATENCNVAEKRTRLTRWMKKAVKHPCQREEAISIILQENLISPDFMTAIQDEAASLKFPEVSGFKSLAQVNEITRKAGERAKKILLYLANTAPEDPKAHKIVHSFAEAFQSLPVSSIGVFEIMLERFFKPDGLKSKSLQDAAVLIFQLLMDKASSKNKTNSSSSALLRSLLPLVIQCKHLKGVNRETITSYAIEDPFLLSYIDSLPEKEDIFARLKIAKSREIIRTLPKRVASLVADFVAGRTQIEACQKAITRLTE